MTRHREKAKASLKHRVREHCRGLRRTATLDSDWTVGFFDELRRFRDRQHTESSAQAR